MEGMERGGGENTSIKKWLMIPGDHRSDVWGIVIVRARWEMKALGTEKKFSISASKLSESSFFAGKVSGNICIFPISLC